MAAAADCQICGRPVLTGRAICEPCAIDERLHHKRQLVAELDGRVAKVRRELAAARAGNGPPSTTVVRASSAATLAAVVAYLDERATPGATGSAADPPVASPGGWCNAHRQWPDDPFVCYVESCPRRGAPPRSVWA